MHHARGEVQVFKVIYHRYSLVERTIVSEQGGSSNECNVDEAIKLKIIKLKTIKLKQ